MALLKEEIDSWDSVSMRPNEKKVYEAIKTLMENADKLEIFNKKAIYLYLREITGLNTKQIVAQLNKMRIKYKSFKIASYLNIHARRNSFRNLFCFITTF